MPKYPTTNTERIISNIIVIFLTILVAVFFTSIFMHSIIKNFYLTMLEAQDQLNIIIGKQIKELKEN
jgi:hypothetical protein